MKPRTLALALAAALFGASPAFAQSTSATSSDLPPSDETPPVEEPVPASGSTLSQDDPAVAADALDDGLSNAAEDDPLAANDEDLGDDGADALDADADAGMDADMDDDMDGDVAMMQNDRADAPLPGRTGAQERRAERDVARMDQDGNGRLEAGEVEAENLSARFADYDIDDDGSLSVNEYQSWLGAQADPDVQDDGSRVAALEDDDTASAEPAPATPMPQTDMTDGQPSADSSTASQADAAMEPESATAGTDAEDVDGMADDFDGESRAASDTDEDGSSDSDTDDDD